MKPNLSSSNHGKARFGLIVTIFSFMILTYTIYSIIVGKEPIDPKKFEKPVNGNGIVINIWLDSYSRLDILTENSIKYLFVDVGDTGKDGSLTTNKEEILAFLDFLSGYEEISDYDFILLPYSEINTLVYDLNPGFIENFIVDYTNLVSMGFDGLLVDIEPVPFDKRKIYLELLDTLKKRLPERAIVSVYSGSIDNSENEWEWDYGFYKEVSERVDIISLPAYDLGFNDKEEYQDYVKEQMNRINSQTWSSAFLLAIPTHKDFPETAENALMVYSEMVKAKNNPFIGFSIFSEWTTESGEWDMIQKFGATAK